MFVTTSEGWCWEWRLLNRLQYIRRKERANYNQPASSTVSDISVPSTIFAVPVFPCVFLYLFAQNVYTAISYGSQISSLDSKQIGLIRVMGHHGQEPTTDVTHSHHVTHLSVCFCSPHNSRAHPYVFAAAQELCIESMRTSMYIHVETLSLCDGGTVHVLTSTQTSTQRTAKQTVKTTRTPFPLRWQSLARGLVYTFVVAHAVIRLW